MSQGRQVAALHHLVSGRHQHSKGGGRAVPYRHLVFLNNLPERGLLADVTDWWNVDHLSADPSHQGKDTGVKYIQGVAAKENLPVVLAATKPGNEVELF